MLGDGNPLDTLQGTISVLGLVPGVGEIFDLTNVGISLGRGRYLDAALNASSALPLLDNFVAGGRFARAALRANPCGCFVAGTSVETEEGPKPIEQIKPGDRVLARDETTGEQSWKPVIRAFVFHDRPVYELELQEQEDDFSRDKLAVTADHPFWKRDIGWVAAEQLKPGDRLLSADGDWLKVGKLNLLPEKRTTHNLEVEGNHNFFVGDTQAWVHNIDCILVTERSIRAALEGSNLSTLQGSISLPVVERYVNLLKAGSLPPAIRVVDNIIIDGNHRYAAGRLVGIEPQQIPGVLRSTAPKPRSLREIIIDVVDYGNR